MEETTQAEKVDSATTETQKQVPETTTEQVASETTTQDKTSQTTEKDGSEPEKESKAVKELKEQRRRRQEAERIAQEKIEEAAYLRGKLESQGTTARPVADGKPVEPKIEAFESYDQFEAARGRYYIDVAKWEMRQEYNATVQKSVAQKRDETFNSRMAETIKTDPDFAEVAMSPSFRNIPMNQSEFDVIKESDAGPKILLYLYNNPDESARIARLSPFTAAKEIGRIEDRILNPPKTETKKISDAPAPITTVKQERATVETDLSKVSMEEFARRRRQGKAE